MKSFSIYLPHKPSFTKINFIVLHITTLWGSSHLAQRPQLPSRKSHSPLARLAWELTCTSVYSLMLSYQFWDTTGIAILQNTGKMCSRTNNHRIKIFFLNYMLIGTIWQLFIYFWSACKLLQSFKKTTWHHVSQILNILMISYLRILLHKLL